MSESGTGETSCVLGSVTRTMHGRENWVGDGWVGYLKAGVKLIPGRWQRRGDLRAFTPENPQNVDAIRAEQAWQIFDGYWGERAEIVLDRTKRWHKAVFRATDATGFPARGGAWLRQGTNADATGREIVKGGWDHEHCAICWETLGPGGQAEGYLSAPGTWICERCYVDFVERGSLDFIASA